MLLRLNWIFFKVFSSSLSSCSYCRLDWAAQFVSQQIAKSWTKRDIDQDSELELKLNLELELEQESELVFPLSSSCCWLDWKLFERKTKHSISLSHEWKFQGSSDWLNSKNLNCFGAVTDRIKKLKFVKTGQDRIALFNPCWILATM